MTVCAKLFEGGKQPESGEPNLIRPAEDKSPQSGENNGMQGGAE